MLRVKRFVVFCLFVVCASTVFSFWVIGQSGADAGGGFSPPPQATAELEAGSTGFTTAVNVTRNPDVQWLSSAAERTGIPARALQAYVAAAVTANDTFPTCGIGWNTVAAVGFVESGHGTHGGSSLNGAGQAGSRIVGPSLNGEGFAAITDTDGGVLDGDTQWDRAVGPMQFIPATWRFAGRDGNADGTADPFNIDDAALSAAVYLCGNGRDLTTSTGWRDAIYSYNQSDAYIRHVAEQATTYANTATE